ncbi:MAG: ABC transporter permease [Methanobacteriota archaeon]|nr:MAG: ABC transporter permease [Euryarchaeota archaeon]
MKSTINILRKELREMFTRSTILPVIVIAILLVAMGNMLSGAEEQATSAPVIGLVIEDDGILAYVAFDTIFDHSVLVYNGTDVEEGLSAVTEYDGTALLRISSSFTGDILSGSPGMISIYWVMRGAGLMDSISSSAVNAVLWHVDRAISLHLIEMNASVDAGLALAPTIRSDMTIFGDKEMDGVSPGELSVVLSAQSFMVPVVIMMLIMAAGGTVISSMGMEKENKTLETLLTLPVRRSSIVTGKLVAGALIGLVMAAIYMVGFNYYMSAFSGSSAIDLEEFDLVLSPIDYVLVGLSLFITLIAALSMCMVVGTFARNYKSAQTLTMSITFLAMVPMFIVIFKDFSTLPLAGQIVLFAIPFSHPMMAMRALMFDDYGLVLGGIGYVTVFAIVMIGITVWIFRTDRLLVGRIDRKALSRRWDLTSMIRPKG